MIIIKIAFSQGRILPLRHKKRRKKKAGLIIFNVHVSGERAARRDMFAHYMNVVKCYYGNSNDCQIIIPALRLDGC